MTYTSPATDFSSVQNQAEYTLQANHDNGVVIPIKLQAGGDFATEAERDEAIQDLVDLLDGSTNFTVYAGVATKQWSVPWYQAASPTP